MAASTVWILAAGVALAQDGLSPAQDGVADSAGVGVESAASGRTFEAGRWQPIYREPTSRSARRGTMMPGAAFEVVGTAEGPGCRGDVWGVLAEGGYTCLGTATPTERRPMMQPELVAFDQPRPEEYFQYIETGTYERDAVEDAEAFLPFIYGKKWRRWQASAWDSLRDYERGLAPTHNLDGIPKYHFVEAIDTERGQVLRRADGVVVPADDVFIYPVDRFHGRDLVADPVAEGRRAAWVVAYDGVSVRADPSDSAPEMATMAYHTPLSVDATPVQAKGRWWRIPDAVMPGVDGWVKDGALGVRVVEPVSRPPEIGPDELWVDVDRVDQTLSLRRGDATVFATLVSTGEGARWATPTGLYRVYDKSVWGDMKSREDAGEPYEVERVPWVLHFKTRYALHGVFWHWGFGHAASHGCVNLAPLDAAYLFERIGPKIGKGWHTTYATPEDPGTHMRVHANNAAVPDRRVPVE